MSAARAGDLIIDQMLTTILIGVPLVYVALQLTALIIWRGGFRWAAVAPLIGWGFWIVIHRGNETRRLALPDPGPIEPVVEKLILQVFVGCLAGLAFLGLLLLVRLRKNGRQTS